MSKNSLNHSNLVNRFNHEVKAWGIHIGFNLPCSSRIRSDHLSLLFYERVPSVPSESMADSGKIRGVKEVVWCQVPVSTKLKQKTKTRSQMLRQVWQHGLIRSLSSNLRTDVSSNLRPDVTSKVSWRSPWPRMPPIWLLGLTCRWISG